MKINNRKKSFKKTLVIGLAVVVVALGGYTTLAKTQSLWPFKESSAQQSLQGNQPTNQEKTNTQSNTNTENRHNSKKQTDSNSSQSSDYVNPPIKKQPSNQASYPIQNEHYKITQSSQTSYHITLYPIANNPEYSDYDAQLKDYKNEALNYLKNRYGNINNFEIKWTPDYAKDA